jgi:hypothetical protein
VNPRLRGFLRLALLIAVVAGLFLIFPAALVFVEMAARHLRYLWWLILLVALGIWLIWGVGRKPKSPPD